MTRSKQKRRVCMACKEEITGRYKMTRMKPGQGTKVTVCLDCAERIISESPKDSEHTPRNRWRMRRGDQYKG